MILPEIHERIVRPAPVLPQVRERLIAARRPRRRRVAAPALLAATGLLVTAGALAATGVLQIPSGAPVKPRHVNRDPHRGLGVPATAGLLPLRVADPAGGPPWGMRLVRTTRGAVCLQPGRVVGGKLGLLGPDHRFHRLPPVGAQFGCTLPDGAGHLFMATTTPAYASGETGCISSCASFDRQIAFGLLGPDGVKVAFTDGSVQEPVGPEHAYLFVRASHDSVTSGGGTPEVGVFGSPIARVDYRDGTSCPPLEPKRISCPLKGYVERKAPPVVHARLRVSLAHHVVSVRFRAPLAISRADRMYVLQGKACGRTLLFVPTDHDIGAGETVRLAGPVAPACHGRLRGEVLLTDASHTSSQPAPPVGRFSLELR